MPRYAQSFIWGLRTDNFYIRKFIQCKDFLIGLLGDLVSWKSYSANFQKLFSHDLEIV